MRRRRPRSDRNTADRMARMRNRRREGRDRVVPVGLRWSFITGLVEAGLLSPADIDNRQAITRAVERAHDLIDLIDLQLERKNK